MPEKFLENSGFEDSKSCRRCFRGVTKLQAPVGAIFGLRLLGDGDQKQVRDFHAGSQAFTKRPLFRICLLTCGYPIGLRGGTLACFPYLVKQPGRRVPASVCRDPASGVIFLRRAGPKKSSPPHENLSSLSDGKRTSYHFKQNTSALFFLFSSGGHTRRKPRGNLESHRFTRLFAAIFNVVFL
jgi:hypothetical protein